MLTLTPQLKQYAIEELGVPWSWTGSDDLYREKIAGALADGTLTAKRLTEMHDEEDDMPNDPTKMFDRGSRIRVKDASEQYDETRYTVKHAKTGLPVYDPIHEREVESQSQGSKARAGVLFKHLANRSGLVNNPLTDHEQSLLDELATQKEWCGKVGGEFYDEVSGHRNVKALIDDGTSGGLEIVPIEFDADVISFPLLTGELFPKVDIRPVSRGRRIEGASIQTPTMSWGGGDNTSIDLFDTSDLVAPIDTTIFAIDGAVEVGRDFMADSPVEVGGILTALIGERLGAELDKVIANGNGTTQPEGLFQASGVGTVTPDNSSSGPPTLADYSDLMFALGKQYRQRSYRPTFISNDTTFARSRAIRVDPQTSTTDQRPVLTGGDTTGFNTYSTLGWDHSVQNDLSNTVCGFAALSKYRLYRRMGLEIRWVDGGKELARRNVMLLVYRARFGGRLMDANAMAKWTDGQS